MLFNEFGNKNNPPVLLLHGMMQDWHSEYEMLKPLEAYYRLIIPAQDGFYDGSGDSHPLPIKHGRLKSISVNTMMAKYTVLMVHRRVA